MKLHHLRLRGITEAFPNEVCVDFDSLGEGLIAIVGENGAGKSTLIGSVLSESVKSYQLGGKIKFDPNQTMGSGFIHAYSTT